MKNSFITSGPGEVFSFQPDLIQDCQVSVGKWFRHLSS